MRPKRQRRRLSLTSLIDVIFLLLLFFMLSSTFSEFSEVPLPLGGTGLVASDGAPLFLRISDADLNLNGRSVEIENLPDALGASKENPVHVIVSTTTDASSQQLVDVLAVFRTLADLSVNILVPS